MHRERGTIALGIGAERVTLGDHIAYFWETPGEFARAIRFLECGLQGADHAVVFGHADANGEVCRQLGERGFDCDQLVAAGRLTVLRGATEGDAMLSEIGGVFQRAIERGAPLVRLLGNIGWGRRGWPGEADLLAFEAKVTVAARAFPSVVVCMYDVQSLPGRVMVHGAYETHPLTFWGNVLRENTHHIAIGEFLGRLDPSPDTG